MKLVCEVAFVLFLAVCIDFRPPITRKSCATIAFILLRSFLSRNIAKDQFCQEQYTSIVLLIIIVFTNRLIQLGAVVAHILQALQTASRDTKSSPLKEAPKEIRQRPFYMRYL